AGRRILDAVPDVDLLVIGDGEERAALEARARALRLEGRVHFLGLRHDVPALLRGADVLLMTSVFEGFPNAVLEAMAMGAVAVATAVGGCGGLVLAGERGVLIPPRNAAAAATAVVRVLEDQVLSTRLAQAARARVERELTVQVLAARTEGFYTELLAAARVERPAA